MKKRIVILERVLVKRQTCLTLIAVVERGLFSSADKYLAVTHEPLWKLFQNFFDEILCKITSAVRKDLTEMPQYPECRVLLSYW